MKRLASMAAIVMAAVALLQAPALAAGDDAAGPPCAEFTGGRGDYSMAGAGTRTVRVVMDLQAAPCAQVTYTLAVSYTTLGGRSVVLSDSAPVRGATFVQWTVVVPDADAPRTVMTGLSSALPGRTLDTDGGPLELTVEGNPLPPGGSYQG